jgi:hypothetical protein
MQENSAERLMLPIYIAEGKMHPSDFQGPRTASTVREAIDYGYEMMLLRINELYEGASDEIKTIWQKHTDEYVPRTRGQLFVPSTQDERQLAYQIADALELQRNREKGEAHLSKGAALHLWMTTASRAEHYLTQTA